MIKKWINKICLKFAKDYLEEYFSIKNTLQQIEEKKAAFHLKFQEGKLDGNDISHWHDLAVCKAYWEKRLKRLCE